MPMQLLHHLFIGILKLTRGTAQHTPKSVDAVTARTKMPVNSPDTSSPTHLFGRFKRLLSLGSHNLAFVSREKTFLCGGLSH